MRCNVATREVHRGTGGQSHGTQHRRVVGWLIVRHVDIHQRHIPGVADRSSEGVEAATSRRQHRTVLRHHDPRRRQNQAGARRTARHRQEGADIHATHRDRAGAAGVLGHNVGSGVAGRFTGCQDDGTQYRGSIGGHRVRHLYIHQRNVAGVGDGTAVGQEFTGVHRQRRAGLGDHQTGRRQHRAGAGGGVAHRVSDTSLPRGLDRARDHAAVGRNQIAAREVRRRAHGQRELREDHRPDSRPVTRHHHVGQRDVADILHRTRVGHQTSLQHTPSRTRLHH